MARGRPTGWRALRVLASVLCAAAMLATAVPAGHALADGRWGALLTVAVGGGAVALFWYWIAMGAASRAAGPHPDGSIAPIDGALDAGAARTGPWGWVGVGLLSAMVVGLVGLLAWSTVEEDRAGRVADDVATEAEQVARQRHVTVAQVADARARWLTEAWAGGDVDPLAELLPLDHGSVSDAVVEDDEALVLIRPDGGGPPCVVLRITDETLDTRRTDDCA